MINFIDFKLLSSIYPRSTDNKIVEEEPAVAYISKSKFLVRDSLRLGEILQEFSAKDKTLVCPAYVIVSFFQLEGRWTLLSTRPQDSEEGDNTET